MHKSSNFKVSISDIIEASASKDKVRSPFTPFDKPSTFNIVKPNRPRFDYKFKQGPGPIYDVMMDLSKTSPTKPNAPTFKVTKSQVPNFIDQQVKLAKNSPGVGKYDMIKQGKVLGNYKIDSAKSAFFDEATARGMDTPSHYNSVDIEKFKMRRT